MTLAERVWTLFSRYRVPCRQIDALMGLSKNTARKLVIQRWREIGW